MPVVVLPDPGEIIDFSYDTAKPTYWQERLAHYLLKLYKTSSENESGFDTDFPRRNEWINMEIFNLKLALRQGILRGVDTYFGESAYLAELNEKPIEVIISTGGHIESVELDKP
jgi:hypothetical protein